MREGRRERSVGMPQHYIEVHIFSKNSKTMAGPDADMTISAFSIFLYETNSSTGS